MLFLIFFYRILPKQSLKYWFTEFRSFDLQHIITFASMLYMSITLFAFFSDNTFCIHQSFIHFLIAIYRHIHIILSIFSSFPYSDYCGVSHATQIYLQLNSRTNVALYFSPIFLWTWRKYFMKKLINWKNLATFAKFFANWQTLWVNLVNINCR